MDIMIDNFPRAFVHRIHTKEGPVAGLRKVIIPQEDGNITVFMPKKCVRLKPNTTKCKLLFDSEKQILAHRDNEKFHMTAADIKKSYYQNIKNWKEANKTNREAVRESKLPEMPDTKENNEPSLGG